MSQRDPTEALDTSTSYAARARRIRARTGGDGVVGPRVTRSEGQRLLIDAPGTYEELATRLLCSKQSLLDWRKGTRVPSDAARRRMLDKLGIPFEAWSQPWVAASTAVTAPITAGDAPAAPPAPPPLTLPVTARTPNPHSVGDMAPAIRGTTAEQCFALLAVIQTDRAAPNLLPSERVKLIDSESKVLKLLSEVQARAELSEDRYVREHPAWIRVRNAIAEALKPHPAAAQAVAAALDRLGI